jgi:hypothetical protein
MSKTVFALLVATVLVGCAGKNKEKPAGDPEERVVAYLKDNVSPGKEVLVTNLLNNVFTEPEEQQAVQRLYNSTFQLPAFVASTYTESGKIPTLMDISTHFNFRVPGTADVLLRVLESDPRVPHFFERNAAGEITSVNVEAVRNAPKFGDALRK